MLEELGSTTAPASSHLEGSIEPFMATARTPDPAIVDRDVAGAAVRSRIGGDLYYLASDRPASSEAPAAEGASNGVRQPATRPMAAAQPFRHYAPRRGLLKSRYANEYDRCLGVLDRRLAEREYMLGDDYSIADMICWPWVLIARPLGASLEPFPHLARWRNTVKARPAVQRGVDLGKDRRNSGSHSEEERKILFGQTAQSVAERAGVGARAARCCRPGRDRISPTRTKGACPWRV